MCGPNKNINWKLASPDGTLPCPSISQKNFRKTAVSLQMWMYSQKSTNPVIFIQFKNVKHFIANLFFSLCLLKFKIYVILVNVSVWSVCLVHFCMPNKMREKKYYFVIYIANKTIKRNQLVPKLYITACSNIRTHHTYPQT